MIRKPTPRGERQRGAALILLTMLMTLVVIPMVGLAVDGGVGFLMQTKLSAAVDAAALAGARSLSIGLDLAAQQGSATATINSYLAANFPPGIYGTTGFSASSSIQESAYKTRTVTVTASVNYPLYFLPLIGHTYGSVSASGQASRRDVNLMLTMDRSGSMSGTPCNTMKVDAQWFADKFTNGRDRLGLVTFKASAHLDFAPSLTFKTDSPNLDSVMAKINCAGNTGSAQALWTAFQQIQAINQPGALNVIVFFTDGQPNGIAANFPVKQQADVRYDSLSTSTLVATPASSCTIAASADGLEYVAGVLAQGAPDGSTLGYTTGLMSPAGTVISDTSDPMVSAPNCAFNKGSVYVRKDIAYIPGFDLWGDSTIGYKPLDTYPGGNPYAGKVRVDEPLTVVFASTNAADDAARQIRSDPKFATVIYCIGLGGDGWVDHDFLHRVANDPQSSSYNPSLPSGQFYYAPDSAHLATAFNSVASQILRLAK